MMKIQLLCKVAFVSMLAVSALFNLPAKAEVVEQATAKATPAGECPAFLNHTMRKLHSDQDVDLCQLTAGKTVIAVNTASNCGFTPQFKSLEALSKKYKNQGLVVIGFPSDDFFQEEDDEGETAKVCFINYGVTFTMLQTSAVRGDDVNPVFAYLGEKTAAPKWNFYKYLISDNGKTVKHFNSRVSPDDAEFIAAVEAALKLDESIATQGTSE